MRISRKGGRPSSDDVTSSVGQPAASSSAESGSPEFIEDRHEKRRDLAVKVTTILVSVAVGVLGAVVTIQSTSRQVTQTELTRAVQTELTREGIRAQGNAEARSMLREAYPRAGSTLLTYAGYFERHVDDTMRCLSQHVQDMLDRTQREQWKANVDAVITYVTPICQRTWSAQMRAAAAEFDASEKVVAIYGSAKALRKLQTVASHYPTAVSESGDEVSRLIATTDPEEFVRDVDFAPTPGELSLGSAYILGPCITVLAEIRGDMSAVVRERLTDLTRSQPRSQCDLPYVRQTTFKQPDLREYERTVCRELRPRDDMQRDPCSN